MFSNVEIQKANTAKAKAWAEFKMKYPNADLSRFAVYIYFTAPAAVTSTEFFFKKLEWS